MLGFGVVKVIMMNVNDNLEKTADLAPGFGLADAMPTKPWEDEMPEDGNASAVQEDSAEVQPHVDS